MNKEQADKIAQKIANDWKLFWMSQTQNSKQDYDNYFRRALAVDANMRAHLESLISAALVDASKVTECGEFDEYMKKRFSTYSDMHPLMIEDFKLCFLAGQKSKALKLPSFMEIEDAATNNYKLNAGLANTFYKGACWVLNEIKSLNEGK